jgi:hypothetical protein
MESSPPLVGQQSNSVGLDIYLFGIVDSGLHFTHVQSNATKDLKAYEYPELTNCASTDTLISIYLAGNSNSSTILYSPFKDLPSSLLQR